MYLFDLMWRMHAANMWNEQKTNVQCNVQKGQFFKNVSIKHLDVLHSHLIYDTHITYSPTQNTHFPASLTLMYSICDNFSTYSELRWCELFSAVNTRCSGNATNKQTSIRTGFFKQWYAFTLRLGGDTTNRP